jgi:stage V sporulation protein D (sporulation-specific penicillin-binding protein)
MRPSINQNQQKQRLNWLQVFVFGLGILVAARLVVLQVVQHNHFTNLANKEHLRKYEVPADRGAIYVQDGDVKVPLALNQTLKLLYADPSIIPDDKRAATAKALAAVTGASASDYLNLINDKHREYVVLAQKIDDSSAQKIKNLNLYGIGLVDHDYRVYPEGQLASQVLGFVNNDGDGQYGIEGFLNSQLKGQPGLLNAKTDTNGVPIATSSNRSKPPVGGTNYTLTLDRNIQAQAEKYIQSGVQSSKAPSGSILVLDPKTGAVKAMANYPTFDPNNYSRVSDYQTFSNPVVNNAFEPGSGFKLISMATGLDTGKINQNTTYTDTGCVTVTGTKICNDDNRNEGANVSMTVVLRDSLNTGVMYVLRALGGDINTINKTGKQVLYGYITKHFGFGRRTGIEQSGEAAGVVNPPTSNDVNYVNMSFGQGINVTMLQMVDAVAAIANGGTMYKPYLVQQSTGPDGKTHETQPTALAHGVVSSATSQQMATMGQVVVQHGTGYLAYTPGYQIAGKTGTAEVPNATGTGYLQNENIGSFTGYAPATDPKFVVMVRINRPQISGDAEKTTVPVFAEMVRWLFEYYGIPPSS